MTVGQETRGTILDISSADYHQGVDETPCLSASTAHTLVTRSPLHAWTNHPKLNPAYERTEDPKFDVGNVVHSMILEGEDVVYVVHADSWRTKDAKEAREEARALGKVPLLAHQRDEVEAMLAAVRSQLEAHEASPPLFADGKPEQTLVWQEDETWLKARLDWLREDFTVIEDIKTTARSADPAAFARRLYDLGYDLKAAFYVRAVEAVTGVRATFRWTVIETAPPFALSVVTPGSDVLALGEAKVEWAIARWRGCMASGSWPAYPARVTVAEMPPWEESRWMEKEAAA